MDAIVVYESLWGNTAEVARAVADGLGPEARALRTDQVAEADVESAGLVVAGAPVFGFKLSTQRMREGMRSQPGNTPAPDLSCPLLRTWIDSLSPGEGLMAAFDTQARGPFGKGAPEIIRLLEQKGYEAVAEPEGFFVKGKYGPLREGEVDRARAWGQRLAQEVERRRST